MKLSGKTYRIKVKSRKRLVIFLIIITLAVVSILISPLLNRSQAMEPIYLKEYFVSSGDTLWEIAKQTLPYKTDIRDYIQEIRSVNNLVCANIKAGQKLFIPIR